MNITSCVSSEDKWKIKFYIDFHNVNAFREREREGDSYPFQRIADILDCLTGGRYFKIQDLHMGYWHVEGEEESKPNINFITHEGFFECHVMLCGLCCALGII